MLYGRDAERAEIGALLEAARESRSGVVLVLGEPGVGKTALLDDAREQATDMQVLFARGIESEAELPFAALHQLLRPALAYADRLPGPQAAALNAAFGLGEAGGHERFLVFAACLSLLAELGEKSPVLCVADDVHWFDEASADALLFVARRLDAEGVVLLLGAREGEAGRFEAAGLGTMPLRGLDAEAVATLLESAAPAAAPAVRDQLADLTNGNALALLELPTALSEGQLAGAEPLPQDLPLTEHVENVFLERVRRLPGDSQRLLLIAAADDTGSLQVVTRAAEAWRVPTDALADAEHARLLIVRDSSVTFRHPLVRSAVYGAATSVDRRQAHMLLAEALGSTAEQADRRAWHVAASVVEPDEAAVQALEEAAERAVERSGHAAAARALERAAELSADPRARGRRLVGAATAASLAGQFDRSVSLAEQAKPHVDDPRLRGEIAMTVGTAEINAGRLRSGRRVMSEAAAEIASAAPHQAFELILLASNVAIAIGEFEVIAEIARLAGELEVPDEESEFVMRLATGLGLVFGGEAERGAAPVDAAIEWAMEAEDPRYLNAAATAAIAIGDHHRAETLVVRSAALARAKGAMAPLGWALTIRVPQLHIAQRWDEAAVAATEADRISHELSAKGMYAVPLAILAFIAAIQGRDDEAREKAAEAIEIARPAGMGTPWAAAEWALGVLELGRGRWDEAFERLNGLGRPQEGTASPLIALISVPDKIEAAMRAGRADAAAEAMPAFEAWATHSGVYWAPPILAACKALVAGGEAAREQFEEALRLHARARPFDLARIQLLYGEHLRRLRRRVDARAQLRAALERFERFGAEPWAERARTELRASGETARSRDAEAAPRLTPQELQVAQLVAQGLSNKEVAAQLFLSPRTIDAHLRSVFAKLEITSRTQLARMPLGDGAAPELSTAGATA